MSKVQFGLIDELLNILKKIQSKNQTKTTLPNIKTLLLQQNTSNGLKFRQTNLNATIRDICPPANIAICSAVDRGKTSFICDMLSYFAPQIHTLYPNRPVLWFTNEGEAIDIYPRLIHWTLDKLPLDLEIKFVPIKRNLH